MDIASSQLRRHDSESAICTISTCSHLAFAITLLQSAEVHAKRSARILLVVDDEAGALGQSDVFEVLRPTDIVDPATFSELTRKYNAAEICFALKPLLLRRMLDAGFNFAHYLDGDTWLVGDFDPVERRLHGANVQLTPHLRAPLPLDGREPTELSLLRSGTYNAGYVGVSRSPVAREFLDWWAVRVSSWGINEPRLGMSGDQKWLDPVPNIFPGVIVNSDPGVNAGYWNLSQHRLANEGGAVTIDGKPLILFHLSGFDPLNPKVLSRFRNRVDTDRSAVISDLLASYAQQVLAAGHLKWSQQTYAHRRWWHSNWLPVRIARALLFQLADFRSSRRRGSP